MYSSGMPLLYILAAASFFVTYWVDKILCKQYRCNGIVLRFYKKPPPYGAELSGQTRSLIKFSILFHFIIGFFMFSNSTILTTWSLTKKYSFLSDISMNNAYFNSQRLYSIHSIIFLASFILCILAFLVRNTLFRVCMALFACCRKLKDKFDVGNQISDDFYQELNIA